MSHLRPPFLPGEFDVAHLPNIIHLDTVERVTGVAGSGGGGGGSGGGGDSSGGGANSGGVAEGTGSDSALHASTSEQASSAFWRGSLYLTNYQLTFVVSDGANAGHFSLGFSDSNVAGGAGAVAGLDSSAAALAPLHPNHDAANFPLLHVPVGSIFKIEQSKYGAKPPAATTNTGNSSNSNNRKDEENSTYAHASAVAAAAAAAANSTLRDVEIQLTVTGRDARVLSFGIMKAGEKRTGASGSAALETSDERAYCVQEFYRLLKKHAFPKETRKLFAFAYMSANKKSGGGGSASAISELDGWLSYSPEREFARMGIGVHPADAARGVSIVHPRRKAAWRLDTVSNARFELSPTYPQAFWIPTALTEKELGKVTKFRSKGRIPVLVFSYSDLLDYTNLGLSPQHYPDTVILRSAQPNVGWTFGRCVADEHLLELAQIRVIIDARPYANAVANQAKGGGYENAEHYKQCRIEFMNIENIHVMRTSLEKLMDLLRTNHSNAYTSGGNSSGDEFWGMIQQSGWLKHVRILLEGAVVCANYIKNGTSILVHCSDGWDRTSQLTSLAQMILDPFYRTRYGFACLVEKEWLSYGHQFHKRCGHGFKDSAEGTERSPIFYQFLDATWQIQQQHPAAFEFNADYLAAVADHLYSGKFGTFLHDNERLRALDHVRSSTHSLWSELNSERRREQFRNPLYGAGGVAMPGMQGANPSMNLANLSGGELGRAAFLHVSADPRKIAIWPYWYRWERRKQNHAPPIHHIVARQPHIAAASGGNASSGNGALGASSAGALDPVTTVSAAHLHHTPVGHMMSFTLSALASERSRQIALEQALAALDADAARLDAAMRALTVETNALRVAKGQQALPVPTSFRQVQGSQFASLTRAPPPPPPARAGAGGGNAIAVAAAARGKAGGTLRGVPPELAAALAASGSAGGSPPAAGATRRVVATTTTNGGARHAAGTASPSIGSPVGSLGSTATQHHAQRGGNPLLSAADDDDPDLDGLVPGPAPLPPSSMGVPPAGRAGAPPLPTFNTNGSSNNSHSVAAMSLRDAIRSLSPPPDSRGGGRELSLLDAIRAISPPPPTHAPATAASAAAQNPNYRALPQALGDAIRSVPYGRGRSGRAVEPVHYVPPAAAAASAAAAQLALSPPPGARPPPAGAGALAAAAAQRALSPTPPAHRAVPISSSSSSQHRALSPGPTSPPAGRAGVTSAVPSAAAMRALSPTPRHDLPRPVASTATTTSSPTAAAAAAIATACSSSSSGGAASPKATAASTEPAATIATAAAPAGPPQFRISAAAFSGVKLKSTIAGGGGVAGAAGGLPRWGQSTLTAQQMKEAAAALKQQDTAATVSAPPSSAVPLSLQKSNSSVITPASTSPPHQATSPLASAAASAVAAAAAMAASSSKPKATKPVGPAPSPPAVEVPAIPPPPEDPDSDEEAPPPPPQ